MLEDPFLIKHLSLRWYDLLIRIHKKKQCGGQKHKIYLLGSLSTDIHIHYIKNKVELAIVGRGGHSSVRDENWTELNWTVC